MNACISMYSVIFLTNQWFENILKLLIIHIPFKKINILQSYKGLFSIKHILILYI